MDSIKTMRNIRAFIALLALLVASGAAQAQTGPSVSLAPSDLQGSTYFSGSAGAVNTQTTTSIVVPANQHAYINYLQVGICGDNTANIASLANGAFTSTNLGGWTQGLSFYQATAVATTSDAVACQFAPGAARTHPLVSAAGPVTVTVVSPAAITHAGFEVNIEYYLAQ